ncbi:hypothetical protein Q5N41_16910 [Vibrio cholerae]|uniref:hypothetical protein n=1 Tax=Vibrio cholerae TaxID=666 RepID=UPI001E4CC38F|nr:hypothetical protein [Vibrio cholerae]EGR0546791.1 hypothetical protein [Vibrio cholerae]EGR0574591.1 hypothetical protein [Vibrio cholerae]EGR1056761.1 hypothetical protein [Vibrio cholerae]EGR3962945.1 hypothetical protein [Vibrio cholerae]EII3728846.1 hypothetical protein [Vibrio cholerae]
MGSGNDFEPINTSDGVYDIGHLKDLSVSLDVTFNNGDTRTIVIHMRPTNHLFSRAVEQSDFYNRQTLEREGYWLKSYVHHEGNYQQIKGEPRTLKENRIFCKVKWADSFFFPSFVELLSQKPSNTTVLANAGDSKTCLSGILEIADRPYDVYLVFFTLTKVNSKEVNMLITSAYCVNQSQNIKAQKLLNPKEGDAKPFVVVLKNVMEGRKPLESLTQNKRRHKRRKNKSV